MILFLDRPEDDKEETETNWESELVQRLSRAAEFRDPETGCHLIRVASYCCVIGEGLGLSEADMRLLEKAAPLHDVGKIAIPDYVLLKPGKLTRDEIQVMRAHARVGYELLRDSMSPILQAGAEIAHCHHESWDGSGYPRGLVADQIPLFGRIMAVADVFDALTSVRPYKPAWPIWEAREFLLASAGKQFDPECVRLFISCWDMVADIYATHHDPLSEEEASSCSSS